MPANNTTRARHAPAHTPVLASLVHARAIYRYSSLRYGLTPLATCLLCRLALLDEKSMSIALLIKGLCTGEEGGLAVKKLLASGLAVKTGLFIGLTLSGQKAARALSAPI